MVDQDFLNHHDPFPPPIALLEPLAAFLFFKGPIVESFCSGNATIVGASLETKTRPSHLSSSTNACA